MLLDASGVGVGAAVRPSELVDEDGRASYSDRMNGLRPLGRECELDAMLSWIRVEYKEEGREARASEGPPSLEVTPT